MTEKERLGVRDDVPKEGYGDSSILGIDIDKRKPIKSCLLRASPIISKKKRISKSMSFSSH